MKRILSASLASLLLLSALASCGGGGEKTTETSAPASGGAVSGGAVSGAADTTETEAGYLGEKNLDGFTFTVNARGGKTGNGNFAVKDLWVEGSTGEPINDAVYDRNALMESKYNFEIVQIESAADQLAEIRQACSAGDAFEAAIVLGTSVARLAQENCLLDLYSFPTVDFTQEWWDQNAVEAFTIKDKMFFVSGDMNTVAFDRTCVTTFSKSLVEDNALENPYDLVRAGKWTMDKMYEMAQAANRDTDSDGKLTAESTDVVGLYAYDMAPEYYFYGAGERISTTGSDGYPALTVYNDRSVQVMDKIISIFNRSNTAVVTGLWANMKKMFTENRAMFANVSVSDAKNSFREECEEDFGFLPIAKFDETQSRYYNLVAFADWTHLWSVPTTCSDKEKVGFLLEAFAYHSRDTVRHAYYDVTLSGKVVRDRDSNDMLNLIFENRVYDIATIYDWGSWDSYFRSQVIGLSSNNFAAFARKTGTKAEKSLQDTLDAYAKIIEQ